MSINPRLIGLTPQTRIAERTSDSQRRIAVLERSGGGGSSTGGGGGSSGAAGGHLTGTFPNPTIKTTAAVQVATLGIGVSVGGAPPGAQAGKFTSAGGVTDNYRVSAGTHWRAYTATDTEPRVDISTTPRPAVWFGSGTAAVDVDISRRGTVAGWLATSSSFSAARVGIGTTFTPTAALEFGPTAGLLTLSDIADGDDVNTFGGTAADGVRVAIRHGTAAAPVSSSSGAGHGPTVKISRIMEEDFDGVTPNAWHGAAGNMHAAFVVEHKGLALNDVMVVGAQFHANNTSTQTVDWNNDAFATQMIGVANSPGGVGAGIYAEGQAVHANSYANGIEVRVTNFKTSGTTMLYSATGFSSSALWITSGGTASSNTVAAGSVISRVSVNSPAFNVGYAVEAGASASTILSSSGDSSAAAFRDDSNSATSLMIGGTGHSHGGAIWIKGVSSTVHWAIRWGTDNTEANSTVLYGVSANDIGVDKSFSVRNSSGTFTAVTRFISTTANHTLDSGGGIRGYEFGCTCTINNAGVSGNIAQFYMGAPTFDFQVAVVGKTVAFANSSSIFTANTYDVTYFRHYHLLINPTFSATSASSCDQHIGLEFLGRVYNVGWTFTNWIGVRMGSSISALDMVGTITNYVGLRMESPSSGFTGVINNYIGVDIAVIGSGTGGTVANKMSLRSLDTVMQMEHAGPARFGATGVPTAGFALDVQGAVQVAGLASAHTAGGTYTAVTNLLTFSAGAIALGAGGSLRGIVMSPAISVTGNTHGTLARAFDFSPAITTAATASGGSITAYLSAPSITAPTTPNTLTGITYTGYSSGPNFATGGAIATTVASLYGFLSAGAVNTDWTVTEANGLRVENLTGSGTVTTFVGVQLASLTKGTTNISLRSAGTNTEMRHAGKAIFGVTATAAPAAGPGSPTFRIARTETITANGAGYAAGLQLSPGYTGAFNVTTHTYIDLNNPTLAGSATLGHSVVFRFDAAVGTHTALIGTGDAAAAVFTANAGPTGTGAILGWMKINVNGTQRYIPFW